MMWSDEDLWPAYEPPPGFTQATVERLAAMEPRSMRASNRLRWVMLSLAALCISGAAYGWVQHASLARSRPAAAALTAVLPSMQQRVNAVRSPVRHSFEEWTRSPPKRAHLGASKPNSSRSGAAPVDSNQPLEPNRPRVPACRCERGFADFICDCY